MEEKGTTMGHAPDDKFNGNIDRKSCLKMEREKEIEREREEYFGVF
jgi:hypothetical protein